MSLNPQKIKQCIMNLIDQDEIAIDLYTKDTTITLLYTPPQMKTQSTKDFTFEFYIESNDGTNKVQGSIKGNNKLVEKQIDDLLKEFEIDEIDIHCHNGEKCQFRDTKGKKKPIKRFLEQCQMSDEALQKAYWEHIRQQQRV